MNNPVTRVDEWRPNYARKCENCGQTPCVQGWAFEFTDAEIDDTIVPHDSTYDKLVYDGTMCGACTWGKADCLDPANW